MPRKEPSGKVRIHLENALAYLNIDSEIERLVIPRTTDKDALVYLPQRVAKEIAQARREIQAALEELAKNNMRVSNLGE